MNTFKQSIFMLLLLSVVSVGAFFYQGVLGITAVVMLYLLVVLAGAYYLRAPQAIVFAVLAGLLINFLFVEPRYTFRISSIESWGALLGFLLVSVVVTSLMRRLQDRTIEAEIERSQAQFARALAERLANESEPLALLNETVQMLQTELAIPACIVRLQGDHMELIPHDSTCAPDDAAIRWVMQNARPLGPGTHNWPTSAYLMLPFSHLPGNDPVLVLESSVLDERRMQMTRNLCNQVAIAYQRAVSVQRAQQAELSVRTKAMQNALLASLSHDMRTPLTAILGAASALESQHNEFDAKTRAQMLGSIRSEADYLCRATENILSLARLNTLGGEGLVMDWQSPEEVVGSTLARYRIRDLHCELRSDITSAALIRGDAGLLSQALANLLDNAIAVHRGSEPLLLKVWQQADSVVISVADRGPGLPVDIDVESLHHLRQRQGRGFGLGLVIVHTIATLHGARLDFESRAGGGTEVSLHFPVTQYPNEKPEAGNV